MQGRVEAENTSAPQGSAGVGSPGQAPEGSPLDLMAQSRVLIAHARYGDAYDLLMRASKLAHDSAGAADESRCLSLLAYAAAALGHNEEAIETAMLATQLAEASGDEPARLMALNFLGVALLWNGSHEGAEAVLTPAFEQAWARDQLGQCWQPQVNRCFNEAYRLIGQRHLEGLPPAPERLLGLLSTLGDLAARDRDGPRSNITRGLWLWLQAIAGAWQHDLGRAAHHEQALEALCRQQSHMALLPAMLQWLRCEMALSARRPADALEAAQRMTVLSEAMHQHPLQRVALRLSCEVHELQGQTAAALASLRRLQQREHRLRQVSMHHRRDVAALRLELRQQRREVQNLRSDAQHLQRLSMEDALTGLANRRALEQQLGAALQGLGRPENEAALYVSVIDVDEFKAVNDRHSHQVGDRVLQALAMLFQQQLRSRDIAGRWGGDEFVLAFWAQDDLQAQGVVERLRQAVLGHDWAQLAPELRIGISLGLTRAAPCDDLASLLQRSDLAMYQHKRCGAAGPGTDLAATPA